MCARVWPGMIPAKAKAVLNTHQSIVQCVMRTSIGICLHMSYLLESTSYLLVHTEYLLVPTRRAWTALCLDVHVISDWIVTFLADLRL